MLPIASARSAQAESSVHIVQWLMTSPQCRSVAKGNAQASLRKCDLVCRAARQAAAFSLLKFGATFE